MISIPKLADEDSCMDMKCLTIQVHCGGTMLLQLLYNVM